VHQKSELANFRTNARTSLTSILPGLAGGVVSGWLLDMSRAVSGLAFA